MVWYEQKYSGGLAYRSLPCKFPSLTSANTPDGQLIPGGNYDVCSERLDHNRTVWESFLNKPKSVYLSYSYNPSSCAPLDGVSQRDPTTGEIYTTIDGQTPNSTGGTDGVILH